MRPVHIAVAVVSLGGLGVMVMAGGQSVSRDSRFATSAVSGPASDDQTAQQPGAARQKIDPPRPSGLGRTGAVRGAPPSEVDSAGLERIEPRGALSKLGLALPSRPMPADWDGTILYRPVATESGLVEAMGYTIAIAGVDSVSPEESCDFAGKSWDCGVRARAAFRSWLRGRAINCIVPPKPEREIIVAECRLGKQDVGQWLVQNGWARAAPGGPYGEAGNQAEQRKKGLFGAPPVKGGLPPAPPVFEAQPTPTID